MISNQRVLVVDDDPVIRSFVSANLRARNFEVITAGEGGAALREIEENHLDLVILDVMMPGIDGIEVCRRIRETSGVPVMMMSAKVEEASQAAAALYGADDYLCKPFGIDDLMTRVSRMLNQEYGAATFAETNSY